LWVLGVDVLLVMLVDLVLLFIINLMCGKVVVFGMSIWLIV